MTKVKPPAAAPCVSCPYRRDVPSGVWDESEYSKLPEYDLETGRQPTSMFICHQQDGRLCAGWCGTHDMDENLALRLAAFSGKLSFADAETIATYTTTVPLFASGQEAADHGRAEIETPGLDAVEAITRLKRKRQRGTR